MTILVAQPDQRAASIPPWVIDLQSFRRWACSDDFPQSGWYAHLGGNLWVDTNVETFSHNQLKGEIGRGLLTLSKAHDSGKYFGDRMLLTHVEAGISTEPDGMFVSHESLNAGRAELKRGADSVEVLGTPDMVLEVVSRTSRQKDRVILPDLYHSAKVREYWIVEAVSDRIVFDLLVWQAEGFSVAPSIDGWVESPVFGKSFRISISNDRSGFPDYRLESR